jgi:hypothetical protein
MGKRSFRIYLVFFCAKICDGGNILNAVLIHENCIIESPLNGTKLLEYLLWKVSIRCCLYCKNENHNFEKNNCKIFVVNEWT